MANELFIGNSYVNGRISELKQKPQVEYKQNLNDGKQQIYFTADKQNFKIEADDLKISKSLADSLKNGKIPTDSVLKINSDGYKNIAKAEINYIDLEDNKAVETKTKPDIKNEPENIGVRPFKTSKTTNTAAVIAGVALAGGAVAYVASGVITPRFPAAIAGTIGAIAGGVTGTLVAPPIGNIIGAIGLGAISYKATYAVASLIIPEAASANLLLTSKVVAVGGAVAGAVALGSLANDYFKNKEK